MKIDENGWAEMETPGDDVPAAMYNMMRMMRRKAHPTELQQQAQPPRYDSTDHPSQGSFAIEQAWPVEGEGKLWTPPDNPRDQPEK